MCLLFGLLMVLAAASTFAQPLPPYLPKNGLIAWFPFDGNAQDRSGNEFHLQVHGPELTDDRLGNSQSAYIFQGTPETAQWLEAENPKPFAATAFTVSAWIKPVHLNPVSIPSFNFNQQSILGYYPADWSSAPAYALTLFQEDNSKVNARIWSKAKPGLHWSTHGDPILVSGRAARVDQWLHLAVTFDGSMLTLYLNAKQVASRKSTLGYEEQEHFLIGGGIWSHDSKIKCGFQGVIDDIGFWDRVLSSQEIQKVYKAIGLQGSVRDIDGNSYRTVIIDGQEWMAENLRTTRFANGDPIPYVADRCDWSLITSPAFCYPENEEKHTVPYGRLYNWYAVTDTRNVCPADWHPPSDIEMKKLVIHFDSLAVSNLDAFGDESYHAATALKDSSNTAWVYGPDSVTNESGFSFLPAGHREFFGAQTFTLGRYGYLWTTTALSGWQAWLRSMDSQSNVVARQYADKRAGFSVRCIKGALDASFNSPPTDIVLSGTVIPDNLPEKSMVGIIATSDKEGGTFLYVLPADTLHTDNAAFDIGSLTIGHLKTLRLLDEPNANTKPEYTVRIRAIDGGGLAFEKEFKITVERSFPAFINLPFASLTIGLILSAISVVVLMKSRRKQNQQMKPDQPVFDLKEEDLIRAFQRQPSHAMTVEEVNVVLGTAAKSIEVQKKHRSDTLRSINRKYSEFTGDSEKLLTQERQEGDKRLARYVMLTVKFKQIEDRLTNKGSTV